MKLEDLLYYCTDGAVIWMQEDYAAGRPVQEGRIVLLYAEWGAKMATGIFRKVKEEEIVTIRGNTLAEAPEWKTKPEIALIVPRELLEAAARAVRTGAALGESWVRQEGELWRREPCDNEKDA